MLRKPSLMVLLVVTVLASSFKSSEAFIVTSQAGDLFIEFISSEASANYIEFGLGTPSPNSALSERNPALIKEGGALTTGPLSNMGFFPAGANLDFYMTCFFGQTYWAFTSNLNSSPTSSDLVTFKDTNNSLGFGGSIIEPSGINKWIFHMDDPASARYDDDDNDFVVRVQVIPQVVPIPTSLLLLVSGLMVFLGLKVLISSLPNHSTSR